MTAATVPAGLELILVRAAVVGLAELDRANGALPVSAGQLRAWLGALAASAGGTPPAMLRPLPPITAPAPCDTSTAAALLTITPRQVTNLIKAGRLDGRKLARTWLLDRRQVDDLVRQRHGNRQVPQSAS